MVLYFSDDIRALTHDQARKKLEEKVWIFMQVIINGVKNGLEEHAKEEPNNFRSEKRLQETKRTLRRMLTSNVYYKNIWEKNQVFYSERLEQLLDLMTAENIFTMWNALTQEQDKARSIIIKNYEASEPETQEPETTLPRRSEPQAVEPTSLQSPRPSSPRRLPSSPVKSSAATLKVTVPIETEVLIEVLPTPQQVQPMVVDSPVQEAMSPRLQDIMAQAQDFSSSSEVEDSPTAQPKKRQTNSCRMF